MLPFILATLGGYFIGSSLKNEEEYAKGGEIMTLYKGDRYRMPNGIVFVIGDKIKDEYGIAIELINEQSGQKFINDLEKAKKFLQKEKAHKIIVLDGVEYAEGGEIENKIDELYEKSNFINSHFNWKLKLLELLQDRSIEAYQVYQSLSKKQKDEVLQELYEVDNDMGSDGDGDIKTSKENLKILLDGAKNGNKYAEGGIIDDLITKINAILQKEVPNFFYSVTKYKSYFGNEEQIAIKIAASDYEINNVRGQYPQLVSLLLNVDTMDLNVQVFGGNGGNRIYRDINPNDPKEKFYAMIGIKVPFRTPQKNEKAVLNAIQKFVQNYKQALRDNIQTLRYKNNVDYETLLKN